MAEIVAKWVESTLWVGMDSRGQSVTVGQSSEREPNWQGMKASDLLLLAAAACSGHDVATILAKARQPMRSLEIRCRGEQLPDPPYTFTRIHMEYRFRGEVNEKLVARAIRLSHEKYCSVTNTLKAAVEITTEYSIEA